MFDFRTVANTRRRKNYATGRFHCWSWFIRNIFSWETITNGVSYVS